jgi:hypothetical protein
MPLCRSLCYSAKVHHCFEDLPCLQLHRSQALLERGYRVVANSRSISRSKDLKSAEDLVNMSQQVIEEKTENRKQNSGVRISKYFALRLVDAEAPGHQLHSSLDGGRHSY